MRSRRDGPSQREDLLWVNAGRACGSASQRFHEEVGHTVCAEIHTLKFGRTYRLYDPQEQKAFHEAGGHSDDGCPLVCATAARITADIILRLRGNA